MEAVLAQRLVRRICEECKHPVRLTAEQRAAFELGSGDLFTTWEGRGCDECRGTGYRGRTGIYELMLMDDDLRISLHEDASAGRLTAMAREKGMRLLLEDGLRQVRDGVTTAVEVLRVANI